jgi:IMP dehydrogenase
MESDQDADRGQGLSALARMAARHAFELLDSLRGLDYPPPIPLALAFDDVSLVIQRSEVASRSHVSVRSRLAGDLYLNCPVISSCMDTVTTSGMAIAMANAGGIGFVHRYLPIERQVAEISRVKRWRSHVIEDPYTVGEGTRIDEAIVEMDEHEVGGLIIADEAGRMTGIITRRDIYGEDASTLVTEAMTPIERMTYGPVGTEPDEAERRMHERRIEKFPLLNGEGRCTGLIVMKDIRKLVEHPQGTFDSLGRLAVGAAIGVMGDFLDRADALVDAGADVLVIDVAHGFAGHVIGPIKQVRERYGDLPLVVGNVADGPAYRAMIEAAGSGCGVRVGIGGGSACDTRQVAGSGVPMITSIQSCAIAARDVGGVILADGGIRIPGDLAKAIGAGAGHAMIGSLLASATEAPGQEIVRDGRRLRVYRGMAGRGANEERARIEGRQLGEEFTPEGVESEVAYNGESALDILRPLIGGLKSGMSYSGASDIEEFHRKARFIRMTSAGLGESRPHVRDR